MAEIRKTRKLINEYDDFEPLNLRSNDIIDWAKRRGILSSPLLDSPDVRDIAGVVADYINSLDLIELGTSDISNFMRMFVQDLKYSGIEPNGPKAHLYESHPEVDLRLAKIMNETLHDIKNMITNEDDMMNFKSLLRSIGVNASLRKRARRLKEMRLYEINKKVTRIAIPMSIANEIKATEIDTIGANSPSGKQALADDFTRAEYMKKSVKVPLSDEAIKYLVNHALPNMMDIAKDKMDKRLLTSLTKFRNKLVSKM